VGRDVDKKCRVGLQPRWRLGSLVCQQTASFQLLDGVLAMGWTVDYERWPHFAPIGGNEASCPYSSGCSTQVAEQRSRVS
jgi:hypothetical protein